MITLAVQFINRFIVIIFWVGDYLINDNIEYKFCAEIVGRNFIMKTMIPSKCTEPIMLLL